MLLQIIMFGFIGLIILFLTGFHIKRHDDDIKVLKTKISKLQEEIIKLKENK